MTAVVPGGRGVNFGKTHLAHMGRMLDESVPEFSEAADMT
jgi:hypothetical protein